MRGASTVWRGDCTDLYLETIQGGAFLPYRTLMNDCVRLLIPVINEVFGKNYSGNEKIVFRPNEHFINQQDGMEQKRITDSSFSIISKDNSEEKFILECQSTYDDTLLIRIFEYITQEALDSGSITKYKLTVTIPNAAVLFLRSKKSTPHSMNAEGGKKNLTLPDTYVKQELAILRFSSSLIFPLRI